MRIDIVTDIMCPWGFIGKRWLEQALSQRPEIRADVTWHAFQVNPELPAEGVDREAYLVSKFGSVDAAKTVLSDIARTGASAGIRFAFDRIRRTPNTREAHRLVRYATARGSADAAIEAVFRAYFVEGRDIGNAATLTQIAGELGLEAAEFTAFLASAAEIEQVVAEDRDARRSGIAAVPCFIFDRRFAMAGAHEPELLLEALDAAANDGARVHS
jgi:predicted DsbA family dithiol-disulfide isomerase